MDGQRNAPMWVTALLVVAGLLFVVGAVAYFTEPARSLPAFFPGHLAGSAHHHTKHGIAALVVAVALWAGAWLTSGRRSAPAPAAPDRP